MTTFTIELPEEQTRRLLDQAREAGTTPEHLIRAGVEEWLARPRADYTEAAEYVLRKNAELYRRLGPATPPDPRDAPEGQEAGPHPLREHDRRRVLDSAERMMRIHEDVFRRLAE